MSARETFNNLKPEKKERITAAAVDEFAAHGFHQASINRMVAGLGIAKGSIFKYFGTKEGLFRYVFDHSVQLFRAPLVKAREETADKNFFDRVRAAMLTGIEFIQQHPKIYRIYLKMIFQENFPLRETFLREIRQYSARYLGRLVREGVEKGELRPGIDPEAAVFFLDAVMDRFLQAHAVDFMDPGLGLRERGPQGTREAVDKMIDFMRQGLGRPSRAGEDKDAL